MLEREGLGESAPTESADDQVEARNSVAGSAGAFDRINVHKAGCPACRSLSSSFVGKAAEGFDLQRCKSCGLVYHSELSDPAELRNYYSHYYREQNLAFSPISTGRFQSLLSSLESYRCTNRILDVGCGAGQFLKVAMDMGWSAFGTEIATSAFEQLKRLGVVSFQGELESAGYPEGFFDIVYCSEVIEHLPDPRSLVREIARVLKPGGLLYLTTPNFNSLSRRLMGFKWRTIGKEHICYFTPGSLATAIRAAGFAKVSAKTRNIDPNEIKKLFSRKPVEIGAGFQAEETEALRHKLETRPALKLAKRAANYLLGTTGTGDTIVVRAEK